ncbi:MAG TPA: hypothetical protein VGK20_04165 [Candidatus Binatia bacterium]|jgi:hypothetical protein
MFNGSARVWFGRIAATGCALGLVCTATVAAAKAVTLGRTETNTDYVSAGIGGIGSGPGTLTITGVTGPVHKAFLYWHGINTSSADAVYDNATITFANTQVTGVSLGDSETNCWGPGSSRAFFADVTSLVTGNGAYGISGLDAGTGHNGNGASLIVLFDDGNSTNNHDLVFFEGNDSDYVQNGFPGEVNGWAATLDNINYTGGTVVAQFHVSDGQSFTDDSVTFAGPVNSLTIDDTTSLWDGNSVPNAGFSRAGTDSLWDIHTFDITGAFAAPGVQSLSLTGMLNTGDCHSLVVLMLDLKAGSAPCGNGRLDPGEECDFAGSADADCPGVETCLHDCTCGCTNPFQCNDGSGCTSDSCNVELGRCEHKPACASAPGCSDTCDEDAASCRTCGHPYSNTRCVVNAVFILQSSVDLRSCELCTCDVDSSHTITATDALMVLRSCTDLPTNLQCAPPTTTTTVP